MLKRLKRLVRRINDTLRPEDEPEGPAGIALRGHREYVGGHWDEIGKLQFDFVVDQGLRPEHVFLDIACGSLRGGCHFIRYLEPGHYLGIDREAELIRLGVERELGQAIADEQRPEFLVSPAFEFERFSQVPDRSLAQSLFTHLTPRDIRLCLRKLRAFVRPGHVLLATFWEGDFDYSPFRSHSHKSFLYRRESMEGFGRENGFQPSFIGAWGHPRDQVMIRFQAI